MATDFGIKDGYTERPEPYYFLDDGGSGIVFQVDVYWYAFGVAVELAADGIVDLGCGQAGKLAQLQAHRPDWRYAGIDHGANLDWCQANLPWGEWLTVDFEHPHEIDAAGRVIVCADVIEHLRDPRPLLDAVCSSGCAAAIFSTPERDLTWGVEHAGPPPNPCHVREWNLEEFGAMLEAQGFRLEHLGVTRSNDQGPAAQTILARVVPA